MPSSTYATRSLSTCYVRRSPPGAIAELLLDELGYHVVWHFAGPGGHGIDLLELTPDTGRLVAFEVKGTLRPSRWPRLSRREVDQLVRVGWTNSTTPE